MRAFDATNDGGNARYELYSNYLYLMRAWNQSMKTKLLFWSAVLFLILGLNTGDGTLFIFFSIHFFMLFLGMSMHKLAFKSRSRAPAEPLPDVPTLKK